jgi:formate dehydrogenase gamma subunit
LIEGRQDIIETMNRSFAFLLIGVLGLTALPQMSHGQSRADCLTCHSDQTLTMDRGGKSIPIGVDEKVLDSSPHKKLACIACHTGFNPESMPHKESIQPVNCLTCHKDVAFKHTFHPQLAQAITSRQEPDVSCKDCHGTHNVVSPKVPGSKFSETRLAESCGECHADVKEHFVESAHGKAVAAAVSGAPTCLTCHRNDITGIDAEHDTLSHKVAQEKLCLSCHLDNPEVRARTSPTAGFIASYEQSVHGSALLKGNTKAANCVDCHGSHEMKKGLEQSARMNKMHVVETCAQCHASVAAEFSQSIHGTAAAKGNLDAPVCTNCHGEHNILRTTDPRSPVSAKNLSAQVCSPCHSSVALSAKYGIANDRFKTFSDSYHGLAMRGGAVEVANCASCHGSHNIKPSTDSTSSTFRANLAVTCGKCHPGANDRFGVGSVHVTMAAKEEPVLYWIASTYVILIVVTIGGMFFHNLIDFVKKSKRKLMIRRGLLRHEPPGHRLYLRMSSSERLQHMLLLLSFLTLVVTGFMLRFPEAWWVRGIRHLSDQVFNARSIIHRVAAVMMVAASVFHIAYIFFTPRGRELIRDLLPTLKDGQDAIAVFKYNLGLSKEKPRFGRFSYIEKSEYWALVWGTIIMAATGFIMWFDNTFIGILTKLGYDISRTIHYYEAWLATLAIVVWHFYFVMFNPDTYPINLAFWKGTISEEEMEEEHPLELEEIRRREIAAELAAREAKNSVNANTLAK